MNLIELTKFLVQNLVKDKDSISVEQVNNDDEIIIQIFVSDSDMGSIIGKNGNIANALRTIIQACSYANKLGRIRINIDAKE